MHAMNCTLTANIRYPNLFENYFEQESLTEIGFSWENAVSEYSILSLVETMACGLVHSLLLLSTLPHVLITSKII